MTTEEIIHIYENSRLMSEHFTEEALTAVFVAGLAALHAQQSSAKLDRSCWEGCDYCASKFADYEIKPCANGDLGARAMYIVDGSGPGVVILMGHNIAAGYFDILYCPHCGRPLTEAAWAQLERRMYKCLD